MEEFLHKLEYGPTSLTGWLLLAPCFLVLLGWLGAVLGYGDDAPEDEKRKLGSGWNVLKHYAPPSFIRFTRWFFLCFAVLYVISVLL
jgi:hypothetical protein